MTTLTKAELNERDRHPLVIEATRANTACAKAYNANPTNRKVIKNAVRAQRMLAEAHALVRAELLSKREGA